MVFNDRRVRSYFRVPYGMFHDHMIQSKEFISIVLLAVLSFGTLSCQSKGSRQETKKRTWPSAYPQPTSLKGLKTVAVKVYSDRGIPSDRIAAGPFVEEIERLVVQELGNTDIIIVDEQEA